MNMIRRHKYEMIYRYFLLFFFGPVLLVSAFKNQENDCGQISVDDCFRKVQPFLNFTSLPVTSDKAQQDKFCSDAEEGYNCSSKLLSTFGCLIGKQKIVFDNFKSMVEQTIILKDFCSARDQARSRREYGLDAFANLMSNSECGMQMEKSLECCIEESKIPELIIQMTALDNLPETKVSVCCVITNFFKCVDSVLLKTCIGDVGMIINKYIGNNIIQFKIPCQTMLAALGQDTKCTDSFPVCAGSRTVTFVVEFVVLMSLLLIMLMSYSTYFS